MNTTEDAAKAVKNMAQSLTPEQQERSFFSVVASGLKMADGTAQTPYKAKVRMRNGDMTYVKDLPEIDKDDPQPNGDYHLPLQNNHWGTVEDQSGALWLFIKDDMLHALVVFSDNKAAENLLPLARDGFLQFSTEGYVEDISESGEYGDFWITAVAPVTVGNDPATQVVEHRLKELEGVVNSLSEKITSMSGADVPPETTKTNEADDSAESEDDMSMSTVPQVAEPQVMPTPVPPAANTVPVPEQNGMVAAGNETNITIHEVSNGLSTPEAMSAYVNAMKQAYASGSGKAVVVSMMQKFKAENAITGDAIIPDVITATFFKAWLDSDALSAFRFMNAKVGAVYAAGTTDTAKGFAKGGTKTSQTINMLRRDLKALALYKRLDIDSQDIFDDASGNLLTFRAQELGARINNQILIAALLGGTKEGAVTSTAGDDTRGLYGILDDANAAANSFGSLVATKVTGTANEDAFSAMVRTIGSVIITAGGNVLTGGRVSSGITLFVPWEAGGNSWMTKLLLTKNATDGYLFAGQNIEQLLRINRIVEIPELAATGTMIAVADGAYQLYGEGSPSMHPFFDINDNKDKLLAEQYVAGSLAGYKQAAVYVPAGTAQAQTMQVNVPIAPQPTPGVAQ